MFKLIKWLLSLLLLSGCRSAPEISSQVTKPDPGLPNIIVILIDDAGYADFGFMGSTDLETPNIDVLAKDGVVFTDAHVSASVCAPSRAGLITGRYQQRFGSECNSIPLGMGLDTQQKTIADYLKQLGYYSVVIGKWHLGLTPAYYPRRRGFDEFYGFLAGGRSYFPDERVDQPGNPRAILHNEEQIAFSGYLTDYFGDRAVDFVQQHKDERFFMYLAFNAVHTPMEAKAEHLQKFRDHPRRELAAMTWSLDENVGKLVTKLKKENLYDNTLIFFLSDNGGATNNQSNMGPLKGWKGNKFEGGQRVPFIMSWPARLSKGRHYRGLISSLDIVPTAIAAAGGDLSSNLQLDGIDLLPYLLTQTVTAPHTHLFWRKDKMAAVRARNYKLIRLDDYGYRLYDLDRDLAETIDLRKDSIAQLGQLKHALEKWEKELEIPRWLEEPEWNQVTYEIHQALMENRAPKYINPREMKKYSN